MKKRASRKTRFDQSKVDKILDYLEKEKKMDVVYKKIIARIKRETDL